ncbi:MAG: hypothetical protein ACI9XO_001098 [Paraglaciecola sp.]|jgi:hypothetical protein
MSRKFVSEKVIDAKAIKLGALDGDFDEIIGELKEVQPAILGYLFSDSFLILTQEEKEYLLYLSLVIWESCEEVLEGILEMSPEELEEIEEGNWTELNDAVGKNFRQKLTGFFDEYPQEDLLAFVEDSLVISEEGEKPEEFEVSKEGREPIFIALKTIIDCLAID